MPAGKYPVGVVPETKVSADVKTNVVPSDDAGVEVKAEVKDQAKVIEDQIEESDLKDIEDNQKIPYRRFKEKNDEAKRFKAEKEEAESHYKSEIARLIQESEALRAIARTEPEQILNLDGDTEKEMKELRGMVSSLKGDIENLKGQGLKNRLSELKGKYPDANEMAALGIKKHNPSLDLEEIMETLHNDVAEKTEARLKSIIEQKKAKAKVAMPSVETGFKIKDTERPKSIKEANALLRRMFPG